MVLWPNVINPWYHHSWASLSWWSVANLIASSSNLHEPHRSLGWSTCPRFSATHSYDWISCWNSWACSYSSCCRNPKKTWLHQTNPLSPVFLQIGPKGFTRLYLHEWTCYCIFQEVRHSRPAGRSAIYVGCVMHIGVFMLLTTSCRPSIYRWERCTTITWF